MRLRSLWLVLVMGLSVGSVGQLALSGSWTSSIRLLPAVGIDTALTLQADLGGWKVGGTAEYFATDGYVWQTFDFGGEFGAFDFNWTLLFGPLAPAYLYSLGTVDLSFGGLDFTVYTAHVGPSVPGYFFGGPSGGAVLVTKADLAGMKLKAVLGFGAQLTPFTITFSGVGTYTKTYPVDPFPGGFQFTYLELDLEKVPFCCGITLDVGFDFVKAGFRSLDLTVRAIPICCGVTFDAVVGYTTTSKSVEIVPRWQGIEGCFSVYGDARFVGNTWQGIEIYGFKLRCALGDCTYLELLTALNVAMVEQILDEDIFQGPEFEYLKLGFCGPGCCGGKYTLTVTAYFQPMGSLFGLRRLAVEAKVPLMANFTLNLGLGVTVGGPVNLALGWTFTF